MGTSISEPIAEQTLPPPYKGPRGAILVVLKRAGALTARELSEQLGLSSNAIRHHLRELETEAVIGYRREQLGVGAPTYAWHLSVTGEALFPHRYKELLTEVLDRVALDRLAVWDGRIFTSFVEITNYSPIGGEQLNPQPVNLTPGALGVRGEE